MNKDENYRITIRLPEETVKKIDAAMIVDESRSRNEFIETAIRHYTGVLLINNNQTVLAEGIEPLIRGIVQDSENRITKLLFKEAVELSKLSHILAYISDIDLNTLEKLHKKCVDEVKKINGSVIFEDAYRFQKSKF